MLSVMGPLSWLLSNSSVESRKSLPKLPGIGPYKLFCAQNKLVEMHKLLPMDTAAFILWVSVQ